MRGLADPWSRFWSRMLDLTLYQLLIIPLLGLLFHLGNTPNGDFLAHDSLFINFLGFAIAMAFDSVVQGYFGSTPGRWLAGIRLEHMNHMHVSIYIAFYRNLDVYIKGFCLGFPLFTVITLLSCLGKFRHQKIISWDQDFHTRVFDINASRARTFFVAALFLAIQGGWLWFRFRVV